jgi:hypothetical protein
MEALTVKDADGGWKQRERLVTVHSLVGTAGRQQTARMFPARIFERKSGPVIR